tara:strand:- start:1783 stop:3636 length:1854 start_codon:yes stop_codon:yes gene_type:complete
MFNEQTINLKPTKFLLLISFFVFFVKWFCELYFNNEFDLLTNFIFDIKDHQYFPLVHNLSNIILNPTYDLNLEGSNFLAFPIYSILFHSILFKLFNIYGFIILEFIIIFTFFYIFFKILNKIGFNSYLSILVSLLILISNNLIDLINFINIPYLQAVKEFYNLRIPRPSISHLYLFLFFNLLISMNRSTKIDIKNLTLIGALFAFMWGSFYYNLAISIIIFLFYYLYLNKNSEKKIYIFLKDGLIILLSFIFFSIPILFLLINTEPDYLTRVGLIDLNYEKKLILLEHFINKIFSLSFILTFIVINLLYFYLKIKTSYKLNIINLLYFIFISSFLAPLFFIIISPTISEIYHFANMLVSISFFIFFIFLCLVANSLFYKSNFFSKKLPIFFIFTLLIFFAYDSYLKAKNNSVLNEKIHFSKLIKQINKLKINKNTEILTFDGKVQTYLILDNYRNLTFVDGIYSSISDEIMENKIINIFKFLKLDEERFFEFIKNKKTGWRYINNSIGKTFYMKYQANKLTTFNESRDFEDNELKFISKSSPLHSQQLIIPKFEINRMMNKFSNFKTQKEIEPKIIIINNNDIYTKNIEIDDSIFCKMSINKIYSIYINEAINNNCS